MRFDFECWVVVPRLLAVGLIAAAMSCYGTVSFIPRERVVAESPLGVPAAQYELGSPEHRMGEVRIWSDGGSYKELARHGEAVVVADGMEIENGTGEAGELHALWRDVRALSEQIARLEEGLSRDR